MEIQLPEFAAQLDQLDMMPEAWAMLIDVVAAAEPGNTRLVAAKQINVKTAVARRRRLFDVAIMNNLGFLIGVELEGWNHHIFEKPIPFAACGFIHQKWVCARGRHDSTV